MTRKQNPNWSQSEIVRLIRYAKSGLTSREAAQKLNRPHPATRYKAMMEGIRFGKDFA